MLFISYSHEDKRFVDRLGVELSKRRRYVWIDRWELTAGQSILDKVQTAIKDASALLVVLSKASVQSEWCKQEINSGLMRQLNEKRVVVVPVLLEDCEIPTFLQDKLYADFRVNFDDGLEALLNATASLTSDSQGRATKNEINHDWAIDWNVSDSSVELKITAVSFYSTKSYSVLSEIRIIGNEAAARKYDAYAKLGFDWMARITILASCTEFTNPDDLYVLISDEHPAIASFAVKDSKSTLRYDINISSRRLGNDDGFMLKYDYGFILTIIRDMLIQRSRKLSNEELSAILNTIIIPNQRQS